MHKHLLSFLIITFFAIDLFAFQKTRQSQLNRKANQSINQVKQILTYSTLATGITITTLSLLHKTINPEKDQIHTFAVIISGIILTTASITSILMNKRNHIKNTI